MKTILTQSMLTKSLLVALFCFNSYFAFSQQPDYTFKNPTVIAGTDKQVGATYRFSNVKRGVDGIIKINALTNGMTIDNIDRTADGFAEAFQPEIKLNGGRNGYAEFQITFVNTGTLTPVNQTEIKASALDIDGDLSGSGVLYEYNEINMGGGIVDYNTLATQILVLPIGTAFKATNVTGILFGASVDTSAHDVMYTVKNGGINTFTWRTGVNNTLNSATAHRYTSLYFKSFSYPNSVLAMPKIMQFEGTAAGNAVNLNWELERTDDPVTCTLQRAVSDDHFETVKGEIVKDGTHYSYTDELTSSRFLYRLRLQTATGTVRYSNVISVQKNATTIKELKVYPSVVTGSQFTINLPAERRQQGAVQIINYAGQVVYERQLALNPGTNSISINDFNANLHGNFILAARSGNEQYRSKIIIQTNAYVIK